MISKTFKRTLTAFLLSSVIPTPFAYAKVIEDVKGNKVEIPDNVARLADLWHANNQVVLMLRGADELVATTTTIQKSPWFNEVFPQIKHVPALTDGANIQVEELLKQKPDAVLVSNASMADTVNQAGLKAIQVPFQDFDGLKKTVQITAEVIGDDAPTIAASYLEELNNNIKFVADRTDKIADKDKPTVLHITNASNILIVDGGDSMIGEWIKLAGGKSVLPNVKNKVEVSIEEIISANPDVIIIGSYKAQRGVDKIKSNPEWQSINAVKNNRIYVNPTGTFPWDRYSTEESLQILWAAQLFHPELFKDVDLVAKTQEFYKKYYKYNLSPENAKQILNGLDPLPKQ